MRENGTAVPDHIRVLEVNQDAISMVRGLSDTGVYFGVWVPVSYYRYEGTTWKWHEVAWLGRQGNTGSEKPGSQGDYYSTLHYGYIPDSLLELCRQFVLTITKEWRAACDGVFFHLSKRVSHPDRPYHWNGREFEKTKARSNNEMKGYKGTGLDERRTRR